MSQENVEVVRQVYEAAARRATPTILALYAPDVEFDVARVPMGAAGFEQRPLACEVCDGEVCCHVLRSPAGIAHLPRSHRHLLPSAASTALPRTRYWSAMSRENVAIIERMLSEARDDPVALLELVDEGAVWEVGTLAVPDAERVYRGPGGVGEFFRRWVGAFDDWAYEVLEVIDAGDSVVVCIHQWGKGRGSGVTVDQTFWQTWTLRQGRIVRGTNHPERAEALEAVGLSE